MTAHKDNFGANDIDDLAAYSLQLETPNPAPPPAVDHSGGNIRSLKFRATLDLPKPDEIRGSFLCALRESAQARVEDITAITKINLRYIKALEADNFAILPAPVYLRGFVDSIARAVGADGQYIATHYMAYYRRQTASKKA